MQRIRAAEGGGPYGDTGQDAPSMIRAADPQNQKTQSGVMARSSIDVPFQRSDLI